jgi:chromosome segregation ATPase
VKKSLTLIFFEFQLENLKERIEEESEKKSDALKALSKAQAEIQLWRSKFETEGLGRIDELESSKSKLTARLSEAEETIDSLNQRISATEKTKHRLEVELEDLQLEYERVHAAAIISEKRGRNFDKVKFLHTFTSIYLHFNKIFKLCEKLIYFSLYKSCGFKWIKN